MFDVDMSSIANTYLTPLFPWCFIHPLNVLMYLFLSIFMSACHYILELVVQISMYLVDFYHILDYAVQINVRYVFWLIIVVISVKLSYRNVVKI